MELVSFVLEVSAWKHCSCLRGTSWFAMGPAMALSRQNAMLWEFPDQVCFFWNKLLVPKVVFVWFTPISEEPCEFCLNPKTHLFSETLLMRSHVNFVWIQSVMCIKKHSSEEPCVFYLNPKTHLFSETLLAQRSHLNFVWIQSFMCTKKHSSEELCEFCLIPQIHLY